MGDKLVHPELKRTARGISQHAHPFQEQAHLFGESTLSPFHRPWVPAGKRVKRLEKRSRLTGSRICATASLPWCRGWGKERQRVEQTKKQKR